MKQSRRTIFRDNLRWLLIAQNTNQADFSLSTGLPYKWIRRLCHHGIERTDVRSLPQLQKLAAHFGVEVEEFWKPRAPLSNVTRCKLIRYIGSKHKLATKIVSHFPDQIANYHEPFLGSGEVLGALVDSHRQVERFTCSDICRPLIEVWKLVQNNPERLAAQYENWYRRFTESPEKTFLAARTELNSSGDPIAYYFINRTCRLGQMAFNKNGNLVSSLHFGLKPIDPQSVFLLASQWQARLNTIDIVFKGRDYANVCIGRHDFAYLDPPYYTTPTYRHKFSARRFFNWLRKQPPRFALSLGHSKDSKNLVALPTDFETKVFEFSTGSSPVARLKGRLADSVSERLCIGIY